MAVSSAKLSQAAIDECQEEYTKFDSVLYCAVEFEKSREIISLIENLYPDSAKELAARCKDVPFDVAALSHAYCQMGLISSAAQLNALVADPQSINDPLFVKLIDTETMETLFSQIKKSLQKHAQSNETGSGWVLYAPNDGAQGTTFYDPIIGSTTSEGDQ